jgi:hypothetical protein
MLAPGKLLHHSFNLVLHGIAGILHVNQEKYDCNKQEDEEFQDALENRNEDHHNQNHTNGKIHGVRHHFVDQILHKIGPVSISIKLIFTFPLSPRRG